MTAAGGALGHSLWLWVGVPLLSISAISAVIWSARSAEETPSVDAASAPAPALQVQVPAEPVPPASAEAVKAAPVKPEPRVRQRPLASAEPVAAAPRRTRAAAERPEPRHEGSAVPTRAPEGRVQQSPAALARRADAPSAAPQAAKPIASREKPAEIEAQAEAEAQPEVAAPAKPRPDQPAPVMDDARLEREMSMLSMTQRVLFSDPARALKLARQGEAEFEGSMFTQERQQLLLLALVKLGQVDEAKRLARPYLSRYPNGPFSDRVRRSLASGRVDR